MKLSKSEKALKSFRKAMYKEAWKEYHEKEIPIPPSADWNYFRRLRNAGKI